MRESIEQLYKTVTGQEVFIVGGGYSIRDIDLSLLNNKITIAINDVYQKLPHALAVYWCDSSWGAKHADKLKYHDSTLRFTSRRGANVKADVKGLANSTLLNVTGDFGYDPNPDNVMGNNSGVQCLNLIINMKPRKIYLLGFDMRDNPLKRGETHFHDNHELVVPTRIYKELFVPSMNALAEQIKNKTSIEILNCSKTSALNCFKKISFKEVIKDL